GLNQSELASIVRGGFVGKKAVYVTRGKERVPVRVIYEEAMRRSSDSLHALPVVLSDGNKVYLTDVADVSVGTGVNAIRRRDQQRQHRGQRQAGQARNKTPALGA
ncbi:MAG: efflux RND transporter permease subunit, partial [Gammaproteobacteria bacterium]